MSKFDNYARQQIEGWLRENGKVLKRDLLDKHNQITLYSVGGHLVIVLDMYSKTEGDYQGFEILTQARGNSVEEATDKLEQLLD